MPIALLPYVGLPQPLSWKQKVFHSEVNSMIVSPEFKLEAVWLVVEQGLPMSYVARQERDFANKAAAFFAEDLRGSTR